MAEKFNVYRKFFRSGRTMVVMRNVSEATAQEHCQNPETSSSTCINKVGLARTRKYGAWFDCYGKA